jgi:integrase
MAKTRYNGEGSIRLRTDGRYEARVSGVDFSTGKPIRISRYANTKEEALQILNQLSISAGNHTLHSQDMLLGDWLDFWMEVYMRHNLKQSTRASYETFANRHFKPALGQLRLTEITPQLLQQFYNYKIEIEHLSPKTISNMNLYLHKALDQAYKENRIAANPASALNLPKVRHPNVSILTRDEQAALLRASYSHRYGVFVRLVLSTGLRLGELLGLMWQDLDCRSCMLHIRRTLNRVQIPGLPEGHSGPRTELILQTPKTENSIRSIPILPRLMQDLMQWKTVQDADKIAAGDTYVESGMIVTNPFGGCIEPRTFSDYYHQILQLAGLPSFTFHALRHTFASRALEQGMDFKTISSLLGHYSVAFTMDTYAHVLDTQKMDSMKLMEELYMMDQTTPMQQLYSVLFTPAEDGGYTISAPDFPHVQLYAPTMEDGLEQIRETIRTELMGMVYPPVPMNLVTLQQLPGQFSMQIAV